jgi:hypothetical protein
MAPGKKISINDPKHGNDIFDTTTINLDSIDDGTFHWDEKHFTTNALVDKEYVRDVDDRSTDKNIEIYVTLEPNSLEKIQLLGNNVFDGVIEHFKLRVAIHDSLNFIDGDSGYIKEFKTYDELFRVWFENRKKLYAARFKRILIIYELQIYKLSLIQKFCNDTKNGVINIGRKSKAIQEQLLSEAKYPKIGTSIINDPQFIPIDLIKYEALENVNNLDYKYILQLTQSQLSEDTYAERDSEIVSLKEKMNKLANEQKHFPGAVWWLEEVSALETVIERGLREGWGYDQRKKKYN